MKKKLKQPLYKIGDWFWVEDNYNYTIAKIDFFNEVNDSYYMITLRGNEIEIFRDISELIPFVGEIPNFKKK